MKESKPAPTPTNSDTVPGQDSDMHYFVQDTRKPSFVDQIGAFLFMLFSYLMGCVGIIMSGWLAWALTTPDEGGGSAISLTLALILTLPAMLTAGLFGFFVVLGNRSAMRSQRFNIQPSIHRIAIFLNVPIVVAAVLDLVITVFRSIMQI